jgi:hypothetical protein
MGTVKLNPNLPAKDLAASAIAAVKSKKIPQMIWNVQVQTKPTTARITFTSMFNGMAWVFLFDEYNDQIGGVAALSSTSASLDYGYYAAEFTDLPQNTTLTFRIDVTDPRPEADQVPKGVVQYNGQFTTWLRTAQVTIVNLKEIQGEGEITYFTKLYDWDGSGGTTITQPGVSEQRQYGRAHMDPDGSPIPDPFKGPFNIEAAPDALAIYTYAVVDESGIWPWEGIGLVGELLPDDFFPDQESPPGETDGAGVMSAYKIVDLPAILGDFDISFNYMSPVWDYVFVVNGRVTGSVTGSMTTRDYTWQASTTPELSFAVASPASPRAMVAAGKTFREFQLTPGGQIGRFSRSKKGPEQFESMGDLDAFWFAACVDGNEQVELVALARDGSVHYAKVEESKAQAWSQLGGKLSGPPEVVRLPQGSLHLFGVDDGGELVHTSLKGGGTQHHWERLGDGFQGRVSCAFTSAGHGWLFGSRKGALVRARLTSSNNGVKHDGWEALQAPVKAPVIAIGSEDFVLAIGFDERQVVWLRRFERGSSQPEGEKTWECAGNFADLYSDSPEPAIRKHTAG